MDRLEGNAWVDEAGTHVQLAGLLHDGDQRAKIVDSYPLGVITYHEEKSCAEIFIDEWQVNPSKSRPSPTPWCDSITISTDRYHSVKIFIEGHEELELPIRIANSNGAQILGWPIPVRQKQRGAISR